MREYQVTIEKHNGTRAVRCVYAKDRDDAMAFAKNIFRHHCKKIAGCKLNKPEPTTPSEVFIQAVDSLDATLKDWAE
jgi:hypothetical protein